jgi:hypothetical protein
MTAPVYTPELAENILQELTRSRTTTEICSEPGMPSERTVRQWVEDDIEGFAARYHEARAIGAAPLGRPTMYTPELAERLAAETVRGRHLVDLCDDPGMPSPSTVRNWVAENREDFSQRYKLAQEIGRAMRGGPVFYSIELADRAIGELMGGRTLVDVCNDPGMPNRSTVLAWVRRNEDGFAARYREAREIGSQIMVDELIQIGDDLARSGQRAGEPGAPGAPGVSREDIDVARIRCENRRWVLSRAMPRIYGDRVRIDARHDASDGWAEVLKAVDGKTRGRLPSEDEDAE